MKGAQVFICKFSMKKLIPVQGHVVEAVDSDREREMPYVMASRCR